MFVDRVGRLPEGDTAPLYQQLQRVLRSAIERQVLNPDEALRPGMYVQVTLTLRPPGELADAAAKP